MHKVVNLNSFITSAKPIKKGQDIVASETVEPSQLSMQIRSLNLQKLMLKDSELESKRLVLEEEMKRLEAREAELVQREQAVEHSEQEAKALFLRLGESIQRLAMQREAVIESNEQELVRFCLKICQAVTTRMLEETDAFVSLIKEVLRKVPGNEVFTVRLNREDMDAVSSALDASARQKMTLLADEGLQRADVVVDLAFGTIDARIEKVFEKLEKELC